jgi:anti-sigma factor RsiW
MACAELVRVLTDYLEGAMPDAEARRLEAHLALCDGCTNYVEQMKTTLRVTRSVDLGALDAHAREHLLAAVRNYADE